jgi:uncharacterized membrane protein
MPAALLFTTIAASAPVSSASSAAQAAWRSPRAPLPRSSSRLQAPPASATTATFLHRGAAGENWGGAYRRYRADLGRAILLGLELLVAADIAGTVAAPLDLRNIAALALVVLIRTFLSFSLEVEINGRWPWQGAGQGAGQRAGREHGRDQARDPSG